MKKFVLPLTLVAGMAIGGIGTHFYKEHQDEKQAEAARLFDPFNSFGTLFDQSQFSNNSIKQEEDEKYVYYKVNTEGLNKDSIKVDIVHDQINVSGSRSEVEAEEADDQSSRSEFHSSFFQSFPIPHGVDSSKVKFDSEGDWVVIKLPKSI